jgi:hypothetical protein
VIERNVPHFTAQYAFDFVIGHQIHQIHQTAVNFRDQVKETDLDIELRAQFVEEFEYS